MRTLRVVIADENQAYSKALSEYLQSEYGQALDISCFTCAEPLIKHLSEKEEIDILLIDHNLYNDSLAAHHIKSKLILTENSSEDKIQGIHTLYKYQLGDKLAKTILQSYDANESKRFRLYAQQQDGRLIAVYSPSGGSGKSTIAYNVARQYAMQGKKTIFISMESYAFLPLFNTDPKTHGLSYLIYLLKNKTANLQVKLDGIKEIDADTNLHYIPRNCNSLDYKEAVGEDIALLLDFLKAQSGYYAIILDLDSSTTERQLGVLKHCDLLLNVLDSSLVSRRKNESFVNQISIYNSLLGIDLSSKMINVNNKVADSTDKAAEDTGFSSTSVNIPYLKDLSLAGNGYYPELTYFKKLYDAIENSFLSRGQKYD